nr:hypothetical protein [Moraxella sp.]
MAKINFKTTVSDINIGKVNTNVVAYFNKHEIDLDNYADFVRNGNESNDIEIDEKYNFAGKYDALTDICDVLNIKVLHLNSDNQFEVLDDDGNSLFLSNMDIPALFDVGIKVIIDSSYESIVIENADKEHDLLIGTTNFQAEVESEFPISDEFEPSQLNFVCFLKYGELYLHRIIYDNKNISLDSINYLDEEYSNFEFVGIDRI